LKWPVLKTALFLNVTFIYPPDVTNERAPIGGAQPSAGVSLFGHKTARTLQEQQSSASGACSMNYNPFWLARPPE